MDEQFHQLVGTASCLGTAAELYHYFIPYPIKKLHTSSLNQIMLLTALRAGKIEEAVERSRRHVDIPEVLGSRSTYGVGTIGGYDRNNAWAALDASPADEVAAVQRIIEADSNQKAGRRPAGDAGLFGVRYAHSPAVFGIARRDHAVVATMKAITYSEYGNPDVLEYGDQPMPKVGPGMVLVKVKAAAVNPVDWKIMAGYLDAVMDLQFPAIPGWDVAGVVESVGIDARQFKPGDKVIAYGRKDYVHGGSFAEYIALPERLLARKPASLGWNESAGLPLAGLTAYQVLNRLGLKSGESVVIHGGSGGVGSLGIQIAVALGASVIATASEKNHEFLRSLGAEPVAYGDGLAERVRALRPDGVDVVADFVGGNLEATLAVLAEGGRHASIADSEVEEHGGEWMWVNPVAADLQALADLVDNREMRVEVAEVFPLEKAADAYRSNMEGHTRGKIVVAVAQDS